MKIILFISITLLLNSYCLGQLPSFHADTTAIQELKKRSSFFSISQNYDSVIACQRQLKALYLRNKRWYEAIKSQLEICKSQIQNTKLNEAQASIHKGFTLVKQFAPHDNYLQGEFYNLYGILYYELGDYEKAIQYLKESLRHQLTIKNNTNLSDLAVKYNNIGAIVSKMGDYDEAIYYYSKSLDLRKSHADELQIGESYSNLSVSYYRKKMFNKALDCQNQYLKILNGLKDKRSLTKEYILCYNSLSIYYCELNDFQKALELLNQALVLNQSSEYLIEKTYHNLGYVYRMLGNDDKALHFLNLAIDKSTKKYSGTHPDIGKAYRHMGVIYIRKSEIKKGLRYYQKALMQLVDNFSDSSITSNPQLISIKSKPDLLRTLRDKATALRTLSERKHDLRLATASLATSQLAMGLIEEMRDEYESESARQFINEEALPVYAGALETIHGMQGRVKGDPDLMRKAFEVVEKSKALLLIESLQRKKSAESFGVPDSLLVKERQIRMGIAYYEKQLAIAKVKNDSTTIAFTSRYLHAYNDREHLLRDKFKQNFPRYFAVRNHFSITSLQAIQSFLKNRQTIMVEYFLGEKKIWIYVITPDEVQLIEKIKPIQFNEWSSQYKKCLTDYNFITDSSTLCYQQYSNSAYHLFQFLMSDVRKITQRYQYHKLIVVPHNELAYLPFESFLVKPASVNFTAYSKLDYLIKEMEISYTYSASLHLDLYSNLSNRSVKCIAFGPEFNSGYSQQGEILSTLPYVKSELKAIQNVFDGDFLYGAKATKRIFKERSGEYGVVHLATHSIMDERDPANSRIYFSGAGSSDSVLFAYEVANLSLNTNLVVLSSCETGSGRLAKGEGVMSIGRSFMYAGAGSVVMNLWRSEDKANAFVVSEFYSALGKGETKMNSLHQAKLKYLQNADEFKAHPSFWAGYVLLGDEGEITTKSPFLIYLIVIGGIVFFFLYFFFKKRT